MKKLSLILFSVVILINFSFTNSSEKNVAKGKARVIDGDTIKINKEKIRFAGINSPERKEIGYRLAKDFKNNIKLNKIRLSFFIILFHFVSYVFI